MNEQRVIGISKERPILFNADMVCALLDGRKTQTRRILKSQPPEGCGQVETGMYAPIVFDRNGEEQPGPDIFGAFSEDGEWSLKCPYGQLGDRLWVKETWRPEIAHSCAMNACDCADVFVRYAAGGAGQPFFDRDIPDEWLMPKAADKGNVSPLFMPRWASRITLEIVSVRVERIQDISETDAIAEGVDGEAEAAAAGLAWYDKPRRAFSHLWQRINGAHSWNANHWVWIVEFKRVEAS